MKYVLSIMIVLLIASMSCYLNTKDDSRVSINLTTIPPDVKTVHVAVYDGSVADENLILAQSFNPTKTVDLDVPAGENRIFVVWGEGYSGLAVRCGSSTPVDIDQGTNSVSVNMSLFSSALFSLTYSSGAFRWNSIAGATDYELVTRDMSYVYKTVYFGPNNYWVGPNYAYGEGVKAYSSAFDLYSDWDNPL